MIENILARATCRALVEMYDHQLDPDQVIVQKTRKEFDGDYSINVFPFLRFSKKPPETTATEIGAFLKSQIPVCLGDVDSTIESVF